MPVDYYNGYFLDGFQTTQGQDDIFINGDNVINYTDLNFVAIGTFLDVAPINANDMTHLHVDINVREAVQSGKERKCQSAKNRTKESVVEGVGQDCLRKDQSEIRR